MSKEDDGKSKKAKHFADRRELEDLVEEANKDEVDSIVNGGDVDEEIPRTTSGILAFDVALGGGWPLNQWSEIVGSESDGKTAIAYRTVAANQVLDPNWQCLWVAAEEFVPKYARSIGVDLKRLWIVESNEMERVYDIVLKMLGNRAVDCVVIDSLPALVPNEEDDRAIREFTIGLGARLNAKFFRKSSKAQRRPINGVADRPCMGLLINQWRDKIGTMWGDPRTTPGGKAKNYFFFVRVEVKRDEWITDGAKDNRVGQVIKMQTMKNKTFRPQQVAQVDFYFANTGGFSVGDFDLGKDALFAAMALGVISRSGSVYRYENVSWRGKEEAMMACRAEPALVAAVHRDVLAALDAARPQPVEERAARRVVRRTS
jgi:recombination protein RecA